MKWKSEKGTRQKTGNKADQHGQITQMGDTWHGTISRLMEYSM
jgi:hypothetical protein